MSLAWWSLCFQTWHIFITLLLLSIQVLKATDGHVCDTRWSGVKPYLKTNVFGVAGFAWVLFRKNPTICFTFYAIGGNCLSRGVVRSKIIFENECLWFDEAYVSIPSMHVSHLCLNIQVFKATDGHVCDTHMVRSKIIFENEWLWLDEAYVSIPYIFITLFFKYTSS